MTMPLQWPSWTPHTLHRLPEHSGTRASAPGSPSLHLSGSSTGEGSASSIQAQSTRTQLDLTLLTHPGPRRLEPNWVFSDHCLVVQRE